MKFGVKLSRSRDDQPRNDLVYGLKNFFETEDLHEAQKEKARCKRLSPKCEYQIVEFESKKKLYGITETEGVDFSTIRGASWRDKFVHLEPYCSDRIQITSETIYLSTNLEAVKRNQKEQQEYCREHYDNKFKYVVWDVDLDQELQETTPRFQENKLIKWLMN